MNKEEVIEYLNTNSEQEIYYKYLLGQDVWYFQSLGDDFSSSYDVFKKFISQKLRIPFNNVSIVGSAKTKFSFSPDKEFKEFGDHSDFDLILVSQSMYFNLWQAFKQVSLTQHLHSYRYKTSNIFNGFVSIREDDPNYGNKTIIDWQKLILTFKTELQLKFNIQHDINYRIYSNWESVEDYHIKGISKLKKGINETN